MGGTGPAAPPQFRAPPPKAHCFLFTVTCDASADDIVDGIEAVVGPRGLESLQHQGGMKFCVAMASAAAAQKMLAEGAFTINGTSIPVACVGPAVVHVTAFRVPLYVGDTALAAALGTYGRVLDVSYPVLKGRRHVGNGTRLVRMEMRQAVPNFLTVQGHRVMFDYRGVRKVCSRCGQDGHIGAACRTPRCARCEVFGHDTAGCGAACRRCGGSHATADCLRPRSYAAAAASSRGPSTDNVAAEQRDAPAPQEQAPGKDLPSTSEQDPEAAPVTEEARKELEASTSSEAEPFAAIFTDALPPAPVTEQSDSSSSDDSSSETSEDLVVVPEDDTSLRLTGDVTCEQAAGSTTPRAADQRLPPTVSQPLPPTPGTPPAASARVAKTPQQPVSDDTHADDTDAMDITRPDCKRTRPPLSEPDSPHERSHKKVPRASKTAHGGVP